EVDDCALREAVLAANATPGHDVVVVPGGTYQLSLIGPVEENQSMTGDLDISEDVEILGDRETPVVVVGDGTDRVLQILGGTIIISDLTITGGVASSWGGGIRASNARVTIIDSTISGNMNSTSGGGILAGPHEMTLINCTVSANSSEEHGGGIYRYGVSFVAPASLRLINTTVSGNSATYDGGGIFHAHEGEMAFVNSTIADNTSRWGTAVFDDFFTPGPIYTNTLIDGTCGARTGITSRSNGGNIQIGDDSCHLPHPTDRMNVPDAMIGPLANNGGPTMTHALLRGSPALDTALDAECPADDQRGVPRLLDGDGDGVAGCDVGAYEMNHRAIEVPALRGAGLVAFALLLAGIAGATIGRKRPLALPRHRHTEIGPMKGHFLEKSREERIGSSGQERSISLWPRRNG
ncbi:MAG: hypothetical protein GY835_22925, partial [bacterium]|nr:hypothetical protein [bacterium]